MLSIYEDVEEHKEAEERIEGYKRDPRNVVMHKVLEVLEIDTGEFFFSLLHYGQTCVHFPEKLRR